MSDFDVQAGRSGVCDHCGSKGWCYTVPVHDAVAEYFEPDEPILMTEPTFRKETWCVGCIEKRNKRK